MSDVAELVEFDWLTTFDRDSRLLHYATGLDFRDGETSWPDVRFACGQRVGWAAIPGISTRMTLRRCGACCAVRGLPRGKGSPKNDDACRTILRLDPE